MSWLGSLISLIIIPCISFCQELKYPSDNNSIFDIVFSNLVKEENNKVKKYYSFEYATNGIPHVDVFDPNYKFLLDSVDKEQILRLVRYYCNFCYIKDTINCDPLLYRKMQS